MKRTRLLKSLAVSLFACTIISPVLGYWADPVLLDELNDYENGYAATRPTISANEKILFFIRLDSAGQSRVWEAQRDPETGLFDNQRMLTELKNGGVGAYASWLSKDKLRLYYSAPDPHNLGWSVRPLWMAKRESPNSPWQTIRRHFELEVETLQVTCSLTADEKYIMYQSTPNTTPRQRKIYYSTRNSIGDSFSTPQEVFELNAIGADAPTITPDGLIVYFGLAIDPNTGLQEMWMGRRESLDEPFGNFMPLDEINSQGHSVMGWFSPSWDGQRLYYFQRNAQPGTPEFSLESTGIFVSHWVDPPEVKAANNMLAAIESKQAILEELAAAIEMEIETLRILDQLQKLTNEDAVFKAIQKTKVCLEKSLRDEILAQTKINSSIRELNKAIEEYTLWPATE